MRKKLGTRFPAARIKKIMQADDDVGKIAMAVPVLVSKALELFLQDLCDRTYDITVQRGAKTVNSLHLKHCVHSYNEFDFLKEVVSEVPDYGHSDTAADVKRRKVAVNESNDSDEDSKRNSMHEACHASSSGRGTGRGRGRGRGRISRVAERELQVESGSTSIDHPIKPEPVPGRPTNQGSEQHESPKDNNGIHPDTQTTFDLNAGSDEKPVLAAAPSTSSAGPTDAKEEHPGLSEIDRMAIDPGHLAPVCSKLDEIEEDYDEEG